MKVRKVIEPYWYISEDGRLFSKKSGKFKERKTRINRWNRRTITIRGKTYKLSRLTAIKWVPNPHNYPMVLHKDNNTLNDHKDNLIWGTQSMNMQQWQRERIKPPSLPRIKKPPLTKKQKWFLMLDELIAEHKKKLKPTGLP